MGHATHPADAGSPHPASAKAHPASPGTAHAGARYRRTAFTVAALLASRAAGPAAAGAVVDDRAGVDAVSKMLSRDELIASIAGSLAAPASNIAGAIGAPASNIASVLSTIEDKAAA